MNPTDIFDMFKIPARHLKETKYRTATEVRDLERQARGKAIKRTFADLLNLGHDLPEECPFCTCPLDVDWNGECEVCGYDGTNRSIEG